LPGHYESNLKEQAITFCKQEFFEFQDHNGRKVVAGFDGGHLSSDGGGALLFRELAEGCPDQDVFAQVWKSLQAWPS